VRVGRGFHLPLISLSEGVQSGLSLTSGSCFAPQQNTNLGINLKTGTCCTVHSVQVHLLQNEDEKKAILAAPSSDQSWNFKQSMGARNREGIGVSYRPARLHRLAEFIPLNS
jgi:hypothetical protein